ncbi:CLRC complex-Argonaute linker protein Stc1 [Schizosaccharomyces osmophilus]|uniref:CLRC complex-Argonaute linker protein Stc1 n=1 Tax=Schizosaccharomyces osmophilus TaxID=2545709 RepID=A0AAF0ATB1_9SCHI|nr:CLRC complex-Argonaute linker protein Stc1 [Schizosaccharomyces osmophilus]WBW71371.1 CLRC complex-Argonaute linker protein Stc1 [Schizosaccharomyces osmophilus]
MHRFGSKQQSATAARNNSYSTPRAGVSTQKNNFLTCMRCKLTKGRSEYNDTQWQKGYRYWNGRIIAIPDPKVICSSCQPKQAAILNCPACDEDKPLTAFSKSQRSKMAPRCQNCVKFQRNEGIEDLDEEAFVDPFEDDEDDDFNFDE